MKAQLKNSFMLAVLILLVSACHPPHEHHDEYTCPMHPTVVTDKPGACPVCGMALVKRAQAGQNAEIPKDALPLIESTNERIVANISTIKGIFKAIPVSIATEGTATYDPRNTLSIASRVSGRITKSYLKYEYQPVSKGQAIAEIYSEELVTSQRELLYLATHDPGNSQLIESSERKLELLGLTSAQVKSVRQKGSPIQSITLYSPINGFVVLSEQKQLADKTTTSASMNSDMRSPATEPSSTNTPITLEGQYVSAGQTLFTITNKNSVRLEFRVSQKFLSFLRQGDQIRFTPNRRDTLPATIELLQPYFETGESFVKIRAIMDQPGQITIGQFVSGELIVTTPERLWIPDEAVADLGNKKIVFVKNNEAFYPKQIETGISFNGLTQVIAKLASSDEIAKNGQYMIDSESFIKTSK